MSRVIEEMLGELSLSSSLLLGFGDRVGIEMHDDDGASIFGRIDQIVENSNG
jgi:hypothetical protein